MNNQNNINRDSSAWIFQTWAAFIISVGFTLAGLYYAPIDIWIKGFIAIGYLFTISTCFTLAKTLRDKHEAERIVNRVATAKTEKILNDYELRELVKPVN